MCAGGTFTWMQSVEMTARTAYNGTQTSIKGISYRSASEMVLDRQGPEEDLLPMKIDGEVYHQSGRTVRVRCEQQRLAVVIF